jgi:hypothetical protein
MLQQPNRLGIHQIIDHRAQDGPYRVESFVCLTDVCQSKVIQQDLLYDEDGDSFGKL